MTVIKEFVVLLLSNNKHLKNKKCIFLKPNGLYLALNFFNNMNTGKTSKEEILDLKRKEIVKILKEKFPATHGRNTESINWGEIEEVFREDKIFKRKTLKRHLGIISDDNTTSGTTYDNLNTLEYIKKSLENSNNHSLVSSGTTNFEGVYLIISPSTQDRKINIFPLRINSNGDFKLKYFEKGDVIRGISVFNASYISLHSTHKISSNDNRNREIEYSLHSIFDIGGNLSREKIPVFSFGVAARRLSNTTGLKAVKELLVKISPELYQLFGDSGLTIEVSDENRLYPIRQNNYSDNEIDILNSEIEVDRIMKSGQINSVNRTFKDVVLLFFETLTDPSNIIKLDDSDKRRKEDLLVRWERQ